MPASASPRAAEEPAAEAFSVESVGEAPYGEFFRVSQEWKLSGHRHQVTAGDAAGSLHYKVIVRCHVEAVQVGPQGVAARIECVNFPEDSIAPNPLEGVWIAAAGGLYRADAVPTDEAEWSRVLAGPVVLGQPPRQLERGGECKEEVSDTRGQWCWSERCPGEPAVEGKICFAQAGGLVSIGAHSIADTSDILTLTVERTQVVPTTASPE